LLIVGAGTLGSLIVKQHRAAFPTARIVAETRSTTRHDALRADGAETRTSEEAALSAETMANVVFCVAPGGNDDYVANVRRALALWKGAPGKFVFTSSGGIFAEQDGGVVDETSALSSAPRSQKLVDCEKAVTDGGGTVLRLAGLYNLDRGAHSYWLSQGKVDARPDGLIGLVSYEDSAGAALAALKCEADIGGEVFLICDGVEQTRLDICTSALKTEKFKDGKIPEFTKTEGPIGKRYGVKKATEVLKWVPTHKSWDAFCLAHAPATAAKA